MTKELIIPEKWLSQWQSVRCLTRQVIEAFPEKELFEFSVGGMRPFSQMADELLYCADSVMKQVVENKIIPFSDYKGYAGKTKVEILENWDKTTQIINEGWQKISPERFQENFNLFGMFDFPIIDNFWYVFQNEIHHRGQAYVYLRALNIEPPAFAG